MKDLQSIQSQSPEGNNGVHNKFYYYFFDRKMKYLFDDLFISCYPLWTEQLPFGVIEL